MADIIDRMESPIITKDAMAYCPECGRPFVAGSQAFWDHVAECTGEGEEPNER